MFAPADLSRDHTLVLIPARSLVPEATCYLCSSIFIPPTSSVRYLTHSTPSPHLLLLSANRLATAIFGEGSSLSLSSEELDREVSVRCLVVDGVVWNRLRAIGETIPRLIIGGAVENFGQVPCVRRRL